MGQKKPNGSGLFDCLIMSVMRWFFSRCRNDECQDHLVLTKLEGFTTH